MAELFELVDLGRYPLDRPGSPAYRRMIADMRLELDEDGCAVLPGFVHAAGVARLAAEAARAAGKAHRPAAPANAYLSGDDPGLPDSHPVRQFQARSNAFIPADSFGPQSPLRQIYEYPGFTGFIREALEEPEDRFFRYADPLADVLIHMVEEGGGFPWHFDTNNWTVSLAIQAAEAGGTFEYVPMLRAPGDENYEGVSQVLAGNGAAVRRLDMQPGDLMIFRGRYSLQRVAPVAGSRPRIEAMFSFAEIEGMFGRAERTRQLYGKVLPLHAEGETPRPDTLRD